MKIEEQWLLFRERDIAPEASNEQLMEMRKAFYAGASSAAAIAADAVLPEFLAYIETEKARRAAAAKKPL